MPRTRLDAVFQRLALPHQLLGFLRVVPEGGVLGAHVQVIEPLQRLIPVKDASSAGLCACLISSTSFSVSARMAGWGFP